MEQSRPPSPLGRDYPAAHSMDTEWFAVDCDGHVALFSSGENGAVADDAETDAEGTLRRLGTIGPRSSSRVAVYDPAGRRGFGQPQHEARFVGEGEPLLIFLRSTEPLQSELARGDAIEVAAVGSKAVIFPNARRAPVAPLHKAGACLGCFGLFALVGELKPAEHGLFYYEHASDLSQEPQPYGRVQLPSKPITLGELPADIARALGAVRFESLCFAEAAFIQPVEHVPSHSYGDSAHAFVGTDGVMRPMPAHEAEFRELYGEPPEPPE